jgi:hypothetical protein
MQPVFSNPQLGLPLSQVSETKRNNPPAQALLRLPAYLTRGDLRGLF